MVNDGSHGESHMEELVSGGVIQYITRMILAELWLMTGQTSNFEFMGQQHF